MDITVNGTSVQIPIAAETRPAEQAGGASRGSPPVQVGSTDRPAADRQAAQALAAKIQKRMDDRSISLSFSTYGKENDKISVTVSDKNTGEVIREIPSEELQRLSGKIEEMVGMVFDGRL